MAVSLPKRFPVKSIAMPISFFLLDFNMKCSYCTKVITSQGEVNMKKTAKEKMVRKTYHLPERVSDWIEVRAECEGRSSSNFLTTFLKKVMNGK